MCGAQTPVGERECCGMFQSRQGLVVQCGASGGRTCTQAHTVELYHISTEYNFQQGFYILDVFRFYNKAK